MPSAAESPEASVSPRPLDATPAAAISALSRLRQSVDEGLAASEVRVDVAVDLDNVIGGLQAKLSQGHLLDVDRELAELRSKIAQRVAEGGIAKKRADLLDRTLSGV